MLVIPILILYLIAVDSLSRKGKFLLGTATTILVFFVGAISLDLEVGSMGLPNFGKVAFFAIGAYVSTLLYSEYNVDILVSIIIALALSGLLGFVVAIPTVKLRADYFAIMTIAGGEVVRLVFQNEQRWLWSTSVIGTKSQVISNKFRIELTSVFPFDQRLDEILGTSILDDIGTFIEGLSELVLIPIIKDIPFISDILLLIKTMISLIGSSIRDMGLVFLWQFVILIVFIIIALFVYWFVQKIRNSPYGRTLRAIREDDISVSSVGKDVARFRWQVTTLAALLTGLAGIMYAMTFSSFEAGEFRPFLTFNLYIFIIIGGLGNSKGAFAGTSLVTLFLHASQAEAVKQVINMRIGPEGVIIPDISLFGIDISQITEEILSPILGPLMEILRINVFITPENSAIVVLGIILILFLLFKPAGLIPEPKTDTGKYLSLLTEDQRERSDEAVFKRQSLSEKERLMEESKGETPPT
ncbi:MAG: branched-chain amino acid ABC transporter permease [Candidatus Hodarchaeales archaeon]|jgi:ABC-type branched-subunit amino acid transport system permease subunit